MDRLPSRARGRRAARVALGLGLIGALLTSGVAHAAKTPAGIGCDAFPGTTTIAWHAKDHGRTIVLSWAVEVLDQNGELVSVTPVGTPVQINAKKVKSPFSTATPAGANLWKVEVFDKRGNLIGVGGGTCD